MGCTNSRKADINPCLIGDMFPNFQAQTQLGKIDLYEYMGNGWLIFFSHPRDYTPVCTTELGRAAKLQKEFEKRNAKVIALSVDDLKSHRGWIKDIEETQTCKVDFPIIADEDANISKQLGMIHPSSDPKLTVRSVFIVSPDKKNKLMIAYPPSTGRNFDEILRCLDSLQLTAKNQVATPENWKAGEKSVILPAINNEEAIKKFPQGFEEVKSYLRYVNV